MSERGAALRRISLATVLPPAMAGLVCLTIAGLVGLDVVLNVRATTGGAPWEERPPAPNPGPTGPGGSGRLPPPLTPGPAPVPGPGPGPGSTQNCLEMPNGLLVCDVPAQP